MGDAPSATYAFTKLVVRDLDAMTRYYREVFGLETVHEVEAEIEGSPIRERILGRDGTYGGLILLQWLERAPGSDGEVILGFTTTDIASLFTRAEANGGSVREAPEPSDAAGGIVVGFVADPEGHLAEVVEQ
jgi:predicted enzyme related to lactoylglutathione lyase